MYNLVTGFNYLKRKLYIIIVIEFEPPSRRRRVKQSDANEVSLVSGWRG